MRVIGRKAVYNYIKTHTDYSSEFIDIVNCIENGKWRIPDDIIKDFHNNDSVKISVTSKNNVIFLVKDCNVRLLAKIAYNTGIVYIT
jgi:mRNA-degrading endonuclease HigB of HigAB toxin-antitoxin module